MHQTVLLQEAVEALVTTPNGIYVDGTFGRGGHSRLVLERLGPAGRLFGVDRDPAAAGVAQELSRSDPRFEFIRGPFARLPHELRRRGIGAVHGLLLDLGVSSPQLDEPGRGFSFLHDGPLDMRMNPEEGESAAGWLARAPEAEIARVLSEYGEERFARRIAAAIVAARREEPITTTGRLAQIVSEANPRWEQHKHPATRAFQAIRIQVNRELDELKELLSETLDLLAVGGRLVVISFHSLEDRLVKRFMRDMARGEQLPRGLPVPDSRLGRRLRLLGKPVRAGEAELAGNPRARSAIMRVAEKIA